MIASAFALFVIAIAGALLFTPAVTRLAQSHGWLDEPDGSRKIHPTPIPRIGGLSVYAAFVLSVGLYVGLVHADLWKVWTAGSYLQLILACGAVVAVGLADDVIGVSPLAKIVVQIAAASYLYLEGYRIDLVSNPLGEPLALGLLSYPLTVLWFVGMSNAFNLIDGLDGLAAGVGFVSTASLCFAAALNGQVDGVVFTAALAGALLGFLRYNFNPASIFLGDSGSLFIGFALAAFSIRSSMKASAAIAVAAPLFALALPILDVLIAITRRLLTGRNIFEADHDHIHHRLLRLGLTPRKAVIIMYAAAAMFGLLSLVSMSGRTQVLGAAFLVSVLLMWVGVRQLGYAEFGELQNILARRLLNDRRVYTNNVHLVRFRESLREAASVPELWAILVEMAARLRFTSIKLVLRGPWDDRFARLLAAARRGEGFPVHRLAGESPRRPWSWTVGLGDDEDSMGELVLTQDIASSMLSFEPSYFVDAVSREFTDSLRRLLNVAEGDVADARPDGRRSPADIRALIAPQAPLGVSGRR